MTIQQIFNEIENLNDKEYRFHLAKPSSDGAPLSSLISSKESWLEWQIYKGGNRERFPSPVKYIFSFAQLSGNEFLFGGIFEILDRSGREYKVKYIDKHDDLIGRVVLKYTGKSGRSTVFTPNHILENSEIIEIYRVPYKGEKFCGIENINHDYHRLKLIYDNNLEDWKTALSNVSGIYLLTDTKTGKHYVGSAYGGNGIYGRWSNYIYGIDGGNIGLINLRKEKGEDYFKDNFKFCILETLGIGVEKDDIIKKETLWKEKLLTKKFGYNEN